MTFPSTPLIAFLALLALSPLMAGCGTTAAAVVPGKKLAAPHARLMEAPKPLPLVKEGDSIFNDAANCRAEYGALSNTVIGLQNYVRVITRPR